MPMLDTDIEGLNPEDATQYVLAFITTLRKTEKEIQRVKEETALWRRRVSLAAEKGETGLSLKAQGRVAELEASLGTLEGEEAELKAKVSVLKRKLVGIRSVLPRTVDVDLLLAQLRILAGEKDELSASMRDEEAKAALEELKKKMKGEGTPDV
jgi:phage shock protein A